MQYRIEFDRFVTQADLASVQALCKFEAVNHVKENNAILAKGAEECIECMVLTDVDFTLIVQQEELAK